MSPFYEQLLKDSTRFCQCWAVSKVRVPKLFSRAQRGSKISMDGVDLLDQKTVTYRLGPILSFGVFLTSWICCSKHSPWWRRLEDVFRHWVQKTSSEDVFRRRFQDVLIKMNIFVSVTRLQKTSSRRHLDVLTKTNIFVLAILLHNIFKTFSRRREDVLQKLLQGIFKTSSKRLAKMSSRHFHDVSSD